MKRLLCILSGMDAGGAETFLMKIYRRLDKTEYQMDFCINTPEKCFYEDEILSMGGKIFRIPTKSENLKEYKRQLTDVVKNNGYTNVFRITSSAAGFLDLKIAKKAGAKVTIARSSNSSDGGSKKSVIAHKIGKLLYDKYVDVKIAPSDLAAIYTFGQKAYDNGEVNILHNAVDLDVFKFDPEARKEIRKEFGIDENVKIYGHVGRFESQKNHSFLLDIFAEIQKKEPNSKLMLVGKGKLEENVRQKAKELGVEKNIIFTGVRSDVPRILSAMDVFVFPSLYEGMPNTVIEAQATGLPCVIADTITKEANVTGLVSFMSLDKSAIEWSKTVFTIYSKNRTTQKEKMVASRYEINFITKRFESILF